jgi:nucleotide-binding universal stress UspA family protein
LEEARALAAGASDRIQARFPDWRVRAEGRFGSPASQLLAAADQWKPDLIVAGSHGRSAIGRLILGSVSHKVVAEARCSVRIARGQPKKSDSPVRIVVGVDGSAGAEEAARAVAAREWPAGSEVRLVAAFDTITPTMAGALIPPVVHWAEGENLAAVALVRSMVESMEAQFRSAKLSVSPVVKPGDPKRILPLAPVAPSFTSDAVVYAKLEDTSVWRTPVTVRTTSAIRHASTMCAWDPGLAASAQGTPPPVT